LGLVEKFDIHRGFVGEKALNHCHRNLPGDGDAQPTPSTPRTEREISGRDRMLAVVVFDVEELAISPAIRLATCKVQANM